MVSGRRYFVIGLLLGIVTFAVGSLFGEGIANWVATVQGQSATLGGLTVFIGEPIKWVMLNPIFGAILVALAWPLALIWIGLLFIMLVLGLSSPATQDVQRQF